MEEKRFSEACRKALEDEKTKKGIGTLSEKRLHAVLKHYYEPNEACHEQKVGSFVADILGDGMITEIQTANFNKMRGKLDYFLRDYKVVIVYPLARTKWLSWIDQETGEISNKRKSPKTGKPFEAFFELYKIKSYLTHPNLTIEIQMFDSEEYRYLNGWSHDRKRGSSRSERIPVGLGERVCVSGGQDYQQLIPAGLPAEFTAADYKKASGLNIKRAQTALHVLNYVGAVERIGKSGRSFLYRAAEFKA